MNKSLARRVLVLISKLNPIIFGLQFKSVRVIAIIICFSTFEMVFSAGIVQLNRLVSVVESAGS